MSRRALVLSGGGAKGSFEIGALEELIEQRGLDFEILCGISVGALNAAFLAQAAFESGDYAKSLVNLKEAFGNLRTLWLEEIKGNDSVYKKRALQEGGIVLGADSIYDPAPLEELLERHLNPDAVKKSKRILRIQYVSLETGNLQTAKTGSENLAKYVLASATMPYFFPPVIINDNHLVDGGVRDITPLGQAFDADADEIYVIYASPFGVPRQSFKDDILGVKVNAFHYLARAVGIMVDEIYRTDIEGALSFNAIKKNWEKVKGLLPSSNSSVRELNKVLEDIKHAPIIEIKPERHIIKDALDFSPEGIRKSYRHGKAVAKRVMDSI